MQNVESSMHSDDHPLSPSANQHYKSTAQARGGLVISDRSTIIH
jgi:hypothetical protein